MPEFAFVLTLSGVTDFEIAADRLYDAGCDDALLILQRGRVQADFVRVAADWSSAVASAVRDVRSAGFDVLEIEPDA